MLKISSALWESAEKTRARILVRLGLEPAKKGGTFISLGGGGLGPIEGSKAVAELAALLCRAGLGVVWQGSRTKETGWGDRVSLSLIVREDPETVRGKLLAPFDVEFGGEKVVCRWVKDTRPQRSCRHLVHLEVAIDPYGDGEHVSWQRVPEEGDKEVSGQLATSEQVREYYLPREVWIYAPGGQTGFRRRALQNRAGEFFGWVGEAEPVKK